MMKRATFGYSPAPEIVKKLCLICLTVALAGCRTGFLSYSGGNGSSLQRAVVIKGASGEEAGIAAERLWLEQRYPGYDEGQQALLNVQGRHYDQIQLTTSTGPRTVYFDVTDFFGK